jgi:IS5 family transposase
MKKNVSYRVRNWKKYNRSLINRGNLTLWFSSDAIKGWYAPIVAKGRGRHFTYSDACIEMALTLRSLFRFPLRATQGFLEGLVSMLNLDLRIPHYSRLSRRASDLEIQLLRMKKTGKEPTDLVVDSTGLKIYGEGEWKMRTHGKDKRRTWRKYHVSVDPKTHEVVVIELTKANVHDSIPFGKLLETDEKLGKIYADGAYTHKPCFDAIAKARGDPFIPVRTGTTIVRKNPSDGQKLRNQLIRDRRKLGGKKKWKKESGYHRRSLVETHMFRLKTILGGSLKSRDFKNQKTEAKLMANILNKMTSLGMPETVPIQN